MTPPTSPPAIYIAAMRGDFPPLLEWLAASPESGSQGWRAAGQVLSWMAGTGDASRQDWGAGLQLVDDTPGSAEAAGLLARAALIALDVQEAKTWVGRLTAWSDPRARLWHDLIAGWLRVMDGSGAGIQSVSDRVRRRATERGWASMAVEAVLLAAGGHMVAGALEDATALARRACRMARTEHMWMAHFSASLLLARLRRLRGRPHLAGVIAADCLRAAPPLWSGQLQWEMLFAGSVPPESSTREGPADTAAASAARLMERGAFDEVELSALAETVRQSAPHAADVQALVAATNPYSRALPPPVGPWIAGARPEVPGQLAGLVSPSWAPERPPVAVGLPARPGRRVLGFARSESISLLDLHGTRPSRPEAVAAALLLAGAKGLTRSELFEAAYGFAYRKELHEPSFKVARHQAKKLLGSSALVEVDGEHITATATAPVAVVDPRCQHPLPDVLLRQIAAAGGASARDLAGRLNVSLRSIQAALHEMVEDGVCIPERSGRTVHYVVEDTTFCELTVA